MDLELWLIKLLKDIEEAAEKGENYDLHLEFSAVDEIANAYKHMRWIEIY